MKTVVKTKIMYLINNITYVIYSIIYVVGINSHNINI